MRLPAFVAPSLTFAVAICGARYAFAVAPFTQDFSSGPAGWYDNSTVTLVTSQSSGGPDGGRLCGRFQKHSVKQHE
jgi:hypothetical protein